MTVRLPALQLSASEARAIFEPRVHGGLDAAELQQHQLSPEAVLDFSSSTNPYGPHPSMRAALTRALLTRYPDSSALEARQALSALTGYGAAELVLGNGAAELLWTLARTLLSAESGVLSVEPTFSEFSAAARASGARVNEWRATPETGFALDLVGVARAAHEHRSEVVYLCNPNTPTGSALPAAEVAAWAAAHPHLWLVLDESFATLSERFADAAQPMPGNVARVRSLTKDHGIPGVRAGYLLARAELARAVENNRPQWSTSAFTQAAASAAASCSGFVSECRARLLHERGELARELGSIGIEALPSTTTFLLARVAGARSLRRRLLLEHRILVRDCSSFGLPEFVRLAARPAPERARLIQALREDGRCSPAR